MSRYMTITDVENGFEVFDLPDAEHVHVTVKDGTITAVPMVRAYSTLLRERPPRELVSWVDAP